jgi:hypothetical protein
MERTIISSSMNYENYKNRTDQELKDELEDLKTHERKHFRADANKKSDDIKKEIDKRKVKDK